MPVLKQWQKRQHQVEFCPKAIHGITHFRLPLNLRAAELSVHTVPSVHQPLFLWPAVGSPFTGSRPASAALRVSFVTSSHLFDLSPSPFLHHTARHGQSTSRWLRLSATLKALSCAHNHPTERIVCKLNVLCVCVCVEMRGGRVTK
jgi:hypothetical protein